MLNLVSSLNRRFINRVLIGLCASILALLPRVAPANAQLATGVLALDRPAIAVKAPDHVWLTAVSMAGSRIVAVGEHGVIAYSDDNGVSWHQARVPVDVTLTCLGFANPREGWAAGNSGTVLHTADGGKTWQLQLTGLQVNRLIAAAALTASTQYPQSPGTANAARRANIFNAAGPDKPFLSMLVQNGNQLMIFGAYRMTVRTIDGGRTWADWSLNIDDPVSHHLYDAAMQGPDIYVVGEAGLVFRSTDGGVTYPMVAPTSDATLFGVLATKDYVLTYGVAGALFRSTDQGKSWQTLQIANSENLMSVIRLKSGDLLLAAESGALFISRDQGIIFQPLTNLPMALSDIVQAANGDIIAVGDRGIMTIASKMLGGSQSKT